MAASWARSVCTAVSTGAGLGGGAGGPGLVGLVVGGPPTGTAGTPFLARPTVVVVVLPFFVVVVRGTVVVDPGAVVVVGAVGTVVVGSTLSAGEEVWVGSDWAAARGGARVAASAAAPATAPNTKMVRRTRERTSTSNLNPLGFDGGGRMPAASGVLAPRGYQRCRPHSVLSCPTHRPDRGSAPSATGCVQGR